MVNKKLNFADLINARAGQTVNKPYGSTDANFPLFKTPVNQKILVYIPTLNLVDNGDGTQTNNLLYSAVHKYSVGKQFGDITCIKGFPMDNPVAEVLGYVGHTCPACDALNECWDLVNKKTETMARQIGVDPSNDRDETLKPYRQKYISEMVLQKPTEQVTFPIVVLPSKNNKPTEDAMEKMEGYYVTMSKQRYFEKVCAGLDGLFDNPGHIAGRWMWWNFIYDTGGAQAIARDAAKNAKFLIIQEAPALAALQPYVAKAEEIGAKFTNEKAIEVLTALEPKEYSEIKSATDRVMKETRIMLSAMETGTVTSLPTTSAEQALANFGATPAETAQTAITDKAENNTGDLGVVMHRFS